MSNSSLVNYVKISPNRTSPRRNKITTITIHHMAGNLSVETCGNVFAPRSRQASSNYGIDSNGRVGMYVEEKDRSWCSSSSSNDHQAVTIEVADDVIGNVWHSSDKAMKKLIELCADICRRNGIRQLNYTGNTSGNLTMHKWFANTDCPGKYLEGKFPWIASEVNKLLNGGTYTPPSSQGDYNYNPESKGYLCKGDTGASVKSMQQMLIAIGISCGSCGSDGSFGNDTFTAVKTFQKQNGLVVDGFYGQKTKSALISKYDCIANNSNISVQANKSKISVDGYWGKNTTLKLQKIFNTTQDGIISNQWLCYKDKNPGLDSGWDWYKNPNGNGSQLIKAMQKWSGMTISECDGEIGNDTIIALQRKLGTTVDGFVSAPSNMVKALQTWANKQ